MTWQTSELKELASGTEGAMVFAPYAIGYLALVSGIAYLAKWMHLPAFGIVLIVLVLVGLGILSGARVMRHRDPK
jgi:hypothetical protein